MPQVELVFLGEVHRRSRGQGVSEVSFSPFFQVFPVSAVTGRRFRPTTISGTGRSGRLFWVKAAEQVGFLLLLSACLFTNNQSVVQSEVAIAVIAL